MALMQITIIPLGTATTGVGDYVADVESFLRDRGVPHTLNDMGTVIHGAPDENCCAWLTKSTTCRFTGVRSGL